MSALIALNAVIAAPVALPLIPVSAVGRTPMLALNDTIGDTVGWPTYVRTLAGVYRSLPADQRARTVILTGNYGEAGAIVHYGRAYGLPAVYSGHNELYYHGPPPASATTVVAWEENPRFAESVLDGCRTASLMDDGVDVPNEEQASAVLVCTVPAGGWAAIWPRLQHDD